jgi:hypothetical protein
MRSTACRALSATAGSTVTPYVIVSSARRTLRQSDPLHMWAQITRPHEFELGILQCDILAHRTFGQKHDPRRPRASIALSANMRSRQPSGALRQ